MASLYQQDQSVPFADLFKAPGALYRDTPFWAWNSKLEEKELREQIDTFHEMGMGGFHMHARTGLATPYLSKEFFDRVKDCIDEAKKQDMLAWLYDEDRWPSGSAGGIVTKNHAYRARHIELRFQPTGVPANPDDDNSGALLACYLVKLDAEGTLADYRRCEEDAVIPDGYKKVWCYLFLSPDNSWYNGESYVDTLNPRAIQEFVKVTHDAYLKNVGGDFGKTVPAIFTDEPQFSAKEPLTFAEEEKNVVLPYTNDFPETYRQAYDCDFFATLPELIWELPGGAYSLARYRYHDHISERFAAAFADTIGDWCRKNGILSTGHMMQEPTLYSQTGWISEAMRSYRGFLLPGIDTLCDCQELSTAKQAQSASRQFGRGGVLSELDGVTDWDFDFMGHKGHGDWQAALGITVRVPHLSWVSMAGEAKRDYPASISYQSSWCKKYSVITDHFARVGVAMTRGKALSRIGVIHPIESYWLLWGPCDQTATAREQAEENFENLFQWLLKGLLDFDLLAESLLPIQNVHEENGQLCVGEMRYDAVLVPPTITLRSSTLEILEKFQAAGGEVIFAGDVATLCDAVPSERAAKLAAKCRRTPYARASLLSLLEPHRDLKVVNKRTGAAVPELLYQMRQAENGQRYLFLTCVERIAQEKYCRVSLKGEWQLDLLNTADGSIQPQGARIANGWTTFETVMFPHGHLLLQMTPAAQAAPRTGELPATLEVAKWGTDAIERSIVSRIDGTQIPITLDEPNVLPLDEPEWRLDNGDWQPAEEIFRLDNLARAKMGLAPKSGHIVQPWVHPVSEKIHGVLELRYTIHTDIPLEGVSLALEQPEQTLFTLDGAAFAFQDQGFWTDKCVRKALLPRLEPGDHTLVLQRNYRDDTNIERAFLLGDFGVKVESRRLTVIAPVRTLHWGDIGQQGLPFYGGNVIYHTSFRTAEARKLAFRMPSRLVSLDPSFSTARLAVREIDFTGYHGALLDVSLDGEFMGDVAFAPYQLSLGTVAAGEHKLDITLYGNRYNSFGSTHLTYRIRWSGPIAWRTGGDDFSYEYRTVKLGIFCEPLLRKEE